MAIALSLTAIPVSGGEVDPKAREVLNSVVAPLQEAATFSVSIRILTTEEHPKSNLTIQTEHDLAVSKPDKISFVTKKGSFSSKLVVQGCSEFTVDVPAIEMQGMKVTGKALATTIVSDGEKMYVSLPYMAGAPGNQVSGVCEVRKGQEITDFFFLYDIAPLMGHGSCASMIVQAVFLSTPSDGWGDSW